MDTENVILTELYTLYYFKYRNKIIATLSSLHLHKQKNKRTTTQRKNKTKTKKKNDLGLQTDNGSYALHVVRICNVHTRINVHMHM